MRSQKYKLAPFNLAHLVYVLEKYISSSFIYSKIDKKTTILIINRKKTGGTFLADAVLI